MAPRPCAPVRWQGRIYPNPSPEEGHMNKIFTMKRLDHKETQGCFRYGFVSGDSGVQTLYIRKESLTAIPPASITVNIGEVDHGAQDPQAPQAAE